MGNTNYQNALTSAYIIGSNIGVAPNVLMGQFQSENGQGLSGTGAQQGNYANLMPGGNLASYSTPQQFANAYISTIQHNFPSAIGTGTNATAFGDALANGNNGLQFQTSIPQSAYTNNIAQLSQNSNSLASSGVLGNLKNNTIQALDNSLGKNTNTNSSSTFTGYLKSEGANIAFIAIGLLLVVYAMRNNVQLTKVIK